MSAIVNFLKTSKAKILYLFVGAFILSFGLIYARNYFPFLRDLCGPINGELDGIQNAIRESLSGNPWAILTVLATPLTIIVALVKAFTGKVTAITEQKEVLESQASQMEDDYRVQFGELEKSKTEVEASLTSTRTELDRANSAFREQSTLVTSLQEENARLKKELDVINVSLG